MFPFLLTHTDIPSEPCTKQAAVLSELIMAQMSQGTLLPAVRLLIGLRKDAESRKLGFTIDTYTLQAGKCLSTFLERGG